MEISSSSKFYVAVMLSNETMLIDWDWFLEILRKFLILGAINLKAQGLQIDKGTICETLIQGSDTFMTFSIYIIGLW